MPSRSSNVISAVPSARFIRDVSAMCGHSASGVHGQIERPQPLDPLRLRPRLGERMKLEQLRHRQRFAAAPFPAKVDFEVAMPTTVYRSCPLCEATCGVAIEVEGDRVRRRSAATTPIRSARATSARRAPRSPTCTTIRTGCAGRACATADAWTRGRLGRGVRARRDAARRDPRGATASDAIARLPGQPDRPQPRPHDLRPAAAPHARHDATRTRRPRSISCRTCSRRSRCSATSC